MSGYSDDSFQTLIILLFLVNVRVYNVFIRLIYKKKKKKRKKKKACLSLISFGYVNVHQFVVLFAYAGVKYLTYY